MLTFLNKKGFMSLKDNNIVYFVTSYTINQSSVQMAAQAQVLGKAEPVWLTDLACWLTDTPDMF